VKPERKKKKGKGKVVAKQSKRSLDEGAGGSLYALQIT